MIASSPAAFFNSFPIVDQTTVLQCNNARAVSLAESEIKRLAIMRVVPRCRISRKIFIGFSASS